MEQRDKQISVNDYVGIEKIIDAIDLELPRISILRRLVSFLRVFNPNSIVLQHSAICLDGKLAKYKSTSDDDDRKVRQCLLRACRITDSQNSNLPGPIVPQTPRTRHDARGPLIIGWNMWRVTFLVCSVPPMFRSAYFWAQWAWNQAFLHCNHACMPCHARHLLLLIGDPMQTSGLVSLSEKVGLHPRSVVMHQRYSRNEQCLMWIFVIFPPSLSLAVTRSL